MSKCLVVDDVSVTRFAVEEFLTALGVGVVSAEDGDQAMSILKRGGIDVILLDWHLRDKSGLDLLREIRDSVSKSLPVIVFSGVEDQGKAGEARAAGANDFLTKPTTKEKLQICLKGVGIAVKS